MSVAKAIVIAFILFAVFIGSLVTICVRQDISLVSNDYYRDELAYQQQIERINNTRNLRTKPALSLHDNLLQVSFDSGIQEGELNLFCPSDKSMDRTFALDPATHVHSFRLADAKRGMYRVKLLWSMGGKEFYYEEVIYK